MWMATKEAAKEQKPDEAPEPGEAPAEPAGMKLGSLDLTAETAWKPLEGEDDADPFTVPREVVKQRTATFLYAIAKKGGLEQYGVPRDNLIAARNFFDRAWNKNCRDFALLEKAFTVPADEGKKIVLRLAQGTDMLDVHLEKFGCKPGSVDDLNRWYDFVAERHREAKT